MLPDVQAVMASDSLRLAASDVAIDHFGYDGNQEHKHRRNIPLLRARLLRDPDHVYSWNHLGQALAGVGDMAGAVGAWRRAIEVVRTAGVRSPLDALPYGSVLTSGQAAAVDEDLLDEALQRFPRDCLFRWLRGRRLVDHDRFAEALVDLESLTGIDPETFCSDEGIAYDVRIFGAVTYEGAALCHFRLGQYEESARLYEIAGILDPENAAHRVRQRLASSRAASTSAHGDEPSAIG
jgi:tetratricopeptide (TPR) repeat protein